MDLTTATVIYCVIMFGIVGLTMYWFYLRPNWSRFFSGVVCISGLGLLFALVIAASPLRAARLICFGWFGHLSAYFLMVLVTCWSRKRSISTVASTSLIVIAAIAIDSFWIEPFWLEVTYVRVESAKVQQPMRVAILADFQTDVFDKYQRESLATLMRQRPDVILMAGDYLQSKTQASWESLRDQMRCCLIELDFRAPLGIYAVGGNTDFQRWPEIFAGLPVTIFQNTETIETENLCIKGPSVEDSFRTNISLPSSDDKFYIVLGHAPNFALGNVAADLLAAGHTHGGQVRLPGIGPVITMSKVPRSWAAGVTKLDEKRTLAVARGIGMERHDAPRLRFLCRPQLLIIDIVPPDT